MRKLKRIMGQVADFLKIKGIEARVYTYID